jgi:protein subunit release factor B
VDWNFPVRPAKIEALRAQFQKLGLQESDLDEKFVRGSGKGGQKVNKTNNCVQLIHRPSGVQVNSHHERERSLNRFHALRQLCDAIERGQKGGLTSAEQTKLDKIRKQKSRRKRRSSSKTKDDS